MEITLLKILDFNSNEWKSHDIIENDYTRFYYINKITNELLPANDLYKLSTRKKNYLYDKKLLISANISIEKIEEFLIEKYNTIDSNKVDILSFV